MSEAEAWFLFFILPMVGMTALLVYLTCRVIESNPWPWGDE